MQSRRTGGHKALMLSRLETRKDSGAKNSPRNVKKAGCSGLAGQAFKGSMPARILTACQPDGCRQAARLAAQLVVHHMPASRLAREVAILVDGTLARGACGARVGAAKGGGVAGLRQRANQGDQKRMTSGTHRAPEWEGASNAALRKQRTQASTLFKPSHAVTK